MEEPSLSKEHPHYFLDLTNLTSIIVKMLEIPGALLGFASALITFKNSKNEQRVAADLPRSQPIIIIINNTQIIASESEEELFRRIQEALEDQNE